MKRIPKTTKKILFGFLAIGILLGSTSSAWARRPYVVRAIDPKVNTRAEKRHDHNNNGWVGPFERAYISHNRVNRPGELRCDFNRNGWIDHYAERRCRR